VTGTGAPLPPAPGEDISVALALVNSLGGGPGGPLGLLPGDGRSPRVTCACCEKVFALEVLYPSLAMQADQLAIAFLIEPSATSALPIA